MTGVPDQQTMDGDQQPTFLTRESGVPDFVLWQAQVADRQTSNVEPILYG